MYPKTGQTSLPVNLIRVVAIVLVIMLHASGEPPANDLQAMMYWLTTTAYNSFAATCVPLFVILSGALLLQPSKVNEPIKVFLKKRFNRIGWAFMFWTAAYFAWRYFANHEALTFNSIVQGLLSGAYIHMWFLYLIAGLYLITPVLRLITAYGEQHLLKYLLVLWFLGVAVVPLLQLIKVYDLSMIQVNVFVFGGWIGYYILGIYLQKVQLRSSILYGLLILGFAWTMIGTFLVTFPFNSLGRYYYFYDSLTINMIISTVALFLILSKYKPDWPGNNHPHVNRVVQAISANILPIYLFHYMILESLQRGYFGFKISLTILDPIVEVPLITVVTLFITLGLILLMKKVPVLKKIIG
ncbi:MAG: acyltransferase family protein [Candidatus Bathyarchaeota archaeon]|nr:acyltransferase family protein [Candidatus Bathyarchaeota archaeon]